MQSLIYGRTERSPKIAYAASGQGEVAVFFLHGIGGNKSNWTEQLDYFGSRGFRAIAWDVRGYADSEDFEGKFDFCDISADLAALMDHLGVRRAHFVGLSMGGRILMDFGHRYPDRIHTLTICGAFPSFSAALSSEQRDEYIGLRKAPLIAGRTFPELADSLILSLAGPGLDRHVYERLHDSICLLRQASYLKALEAAVYFDRVNEIQSIQIKTLLLYAENDRLTPPDMGHEVAAMMPNAQIRILPNCGHLMNLESPREFNRIVFEFIQHSRAASEGQPDDKLMLKE